jgi:predicted O-methyltransferase YrrM
VTSAPPTPILDRLLAGRPPLELSEWSLTAAELELVVTAIGPDCESIVECGSGASTIVIARLVAERGRGRVHALEHDRAWAERTRGLIVAEGLASRARVIDAPLRPHPLADPGCEWYDEGALARLPERIDLLLVDGPPASAPRIARARYPALPLLAGRLRPGVPVILDDVGRPGEAWVLERWGERLGFRATRATDRAAIGCIFPPSAREGPGALTRRGRNERNSALAPGGPDRAAGQRIHGGGMRRRR